MAPDLLLTASIQYKKSIATRNSHLDLLTLLKFFVTYDFKKSGGYRDRRNHAPWQYR